MRSAIRQLVNSKFVRNVAIVATGTAGAQAISMAFAPAITRLYGPEAFGMLGTFMAILGVLTPIAALTYPIAIVLPKSDADAQSIAKLSAALALVVSAVAAAILLLAGESITHALSMEAIAGLLLLIPVVMLFSACQQILTQWLIRKKQFTVTARVALVQALSVNSAKAGVGFFHPAGAALIIIAALGQGVHVMLLWLGIRGRKGAHPKKDESTGTVRELAKRHRDFPIYRAPQVILNALTQSLPILVLASIFGPAVAGFFALTRNVLTAPANLLGSAVGNVFYPKAVELKRDSRKLQLFLFKATASLGLLGLFTFLPVVFFGPWIFSLIFGGEWKTAGEFARWIALWRVFSLAARPAISVIPVVGMQRAFLLFEVVFLPIKLLSLCLGIYFGEAAGSVALYSLANCVFYILLYLLIVRKISRLDSPAHRNAVRAESWTSR